MPRSKTVQCLSEICISNIAANMDSYWCKDYAAHIQRDQLKYRYIIGPFEHICNISGKYLQRILYKLIEKKQLRTYHVDLLICSGLNELEFEFGRRCPNQEYIVNRIAYQCHFMNRLKLHAFDQVKLKTLVYLVSSLNRLTHLDLSFTKASDTVVEAIGRNCRSIRVLKLHSCPVTDIGLRSLYSTSDGQPNETCANLEVLDVRETRTHAETVAALLQSLNNMQYLYHDELSEAIWISLTGASPAGLNKLRFFNMRVKFAEDVPSLLLDRIRTSCSNLCEYQQIGKLENGNLEFLNGLPIRALNMISGTNFNGEPMIDFAHDISTFLTRPNAIRVLEFLDVVGVDVGLLAKFCPCLEQLHLEYIYHLEECEIGDANGLLNEHSFDKLKELSLRFYSGRVVMSDDTLGRLFVASRNLTSLNLEEVDAFNDDVMKTVRETNSLKRVENLILIHCNVVSGGALLPLVHGDNELRHLDLMDCWNVTKADSIAMNEFIESKNFDLEVEWS